MNGKIRKIHRFWCKDCKRTFAPDFKKKEMRNDPKAITAALDAYFRGSAREMWQTTWHNSTGLKTTIFLPDGSRDTRKRLADM